MGLRRKARESALQMLFAADVIAGPADRPKGVVRPDELVRDYWTQLGEELDEPAREFATRLVTGTLAHVAEIDERIKSRAEHWRISRMAVVDRNVLRLAVYEFTHEPTPRTVAINEALEVARRFSTYEATQFINGILDAIKRDLDQEQPQAETIAFAEEEEDEAAPEDSDVALAATDEGGEDVDDVDGEKSEESDEEDSDSRRASAS
ncbi:MAG: transcription antitermination protein NusB [Acidobacteriota bacterium]|nr:transcription antitermination protein NusB [Acidobacteriota bacterium]